MQILQTTSQQQSKRYIQITDEKVHDAVRKTEVDYNSVTDREQISLSGLRLGFSKKLGAMQRMYCWGDMGCLEVWQEEAEPRMSLRAGEYPAPNKETKEGNRVCDPTFLGFLRWLFLLNELGRLLWNFNLLPITSQLCYGLNTSWVKDMKENHYKNKFKNKSFFPSFFLKNTLLWHTRVMQCLWRERLLSVLILWAAKPLGCQNNINLCIQGAAQLRSWLDCQCME